MIISLIVLLAFIAVPCFAADTYCPTPSHSQIKKWWKPENGKSPDEEMDIGGVRPVRLKSGEQAFVADVGFPTRGRCCEGGMLLVRPDLQEARQIDSQGIDLHPRVSEVMDLEGSRFAGLVISGSMTSAGEAAGHNTFVYFDEWNPVILHTRRFGSNLGSCGGTDTSPPCHSEEVKWVFVDLDGDYIKDLVELIVYKDGEEPDQLIWKTKVNAYLIKDKQFVPVSPGLIQSSPTKLEGQSKFDANGPSSMQDHKSQSINAPENEQPVDGGAIMAKCQSRLDQAAATVRDILSQFGLTASEPR
jgi:hypothetical protein